MRIPAAAIVLAILLTGCGGDPETPAASAPPSSAPAATPSSSPTASDPSEEASVAPGRQPSAADRRLARAFIHLATRPPQMSMLPNVPFAPTVRIGLGSALTDAIPSGDTYLYGEWTLRAEGEFFRGQIGPFNAFRAVRRHLRRAGQASRDPFAYVLGRHRHCAGPPVPAPAGFAEARRVSLQPAPETIDSCLDWFTVDLFLDDAGQIAAVTYDIWEP